MAFPANRRFLVSACLAGVNCTFRGLNNLDYRIKKLADNGVAIALCPEVFGGLGVPRENIELVGGDGSGVLDGKAAAVTASGRDVTKEVVDGCEKILNIIKKYNIKEAILKANSPTCGSAQIYDGTFSGKLKDGNGVLVAMLKRHGIRVMTEKEAQDGWDRISC